MITDRGRELISKYLLGQAPSYASYISFGCGKGDTATDRQSMDFEMLRVPISSRSNMVERDQGGNIGNTIISFAGDIPLEEQYIITEVAVWSDARNAATQSDSRVLFAFTGDENWQIKDDTGASVIPVYEVSLSGEEEPGPITVSDPIFIADADNLALVSGRDGQGTRFLNRTILYNGGAGSKVFLDGRNVDLSSNSGDDLLKFAFAMYPKETAWTQPPDVSFTIRFMTDPNLEVPDDANPPAGTAVWKGTVSTPDKFNVSTTKLEDLVTPTAFSWRGTRYVEIEFDDFSSDWYVGIDAIRFDNVSTPNPLYVMSGYTSTDTPLVKGANTNAYAEFRFGLNV